MYVYIFKLVTNHCREINSYNFICSKRNGTLWKINSWPDSIFDGLKIWIKLYTTHSRFTLRQDQPPCQNKKKFEKQTFYLKATPNKKKSAINLTNSEKF